MSRKIQLFKCFVMEILLSVRTFREIDMKTVISISYGIPVNKREGMLECVGLLSWIFHFYFWESKVLE